MGSFRPAIQEDYKAIASLHAKSWQENYRGTFSDHFLDEEVLGDRMKVWKDRLQSPNDKQWVLLAEDQGVAIGFICIYLDKDSVYGTLVDNLHVASAFIGQGFGETLMVKAARFIRETHRKSMYLWVLANNTKAIRFYERLGGVPKETVRDFDIGDREIIKTRYHWETLTPIFKVSQEKST